MRRSEHGAYCFDDDGGPVLPLSARRPEESTSTAVTDGRRRSPGACADRIDSADRWLTIGIASAVGSGMLALGGLVVALTAPRDGSARAAVACSVHGCGLRF